MVKFKPYFASEVILRPAAIVPNTMILYYSNYFIFIWAYT